MKRDQTKHIPKYMNPVVKMKRDQTKHIPKYMNPVVKMKRDQTKHIPKYMNYYSSLAYSVTGFYIFLAEKISQ
jgi:hypothetical protein